MRSTGRQASSFAMIGGIGFIVDGGILTILDGVFGVELFPARLVSFSAAVTTTWLLNRHRTFADRKELRAVREWGRYVAVNGIGFLLNMGIFFWLVYRWQIFADLPIVPLAIASSIALIFNFLASKYVVFRYRVPIPRTDQSGAPPTIHQHSGGENLEVMREARKYNQYLRELVQRFCGDAETALDFGAGIGTFSDSVNIPRDRIHCVEPDKGVQLYLASEGFNAHESLAEVADSTIDYLFTLNVLEHIEDDSAILDEIFRVVRPGGRILVYVPAFMILFTSMDSHVGHHRRYRLKGLTKIVENAGFHIEKRAYFDALGFFATLVFKLFDSPKPAPLDSRMVGLYDRYVFPASRLLSVLFARILGKNLYIVARRPESDSV